MQALEVRHLGGIAGLDQRLVACLHQRGRAAAQHGLLAEQVGLGLFLERRLDHAGTGGADRGSIGQRDIARLATGVLGDRDQRGHAAALGVGRAHEVAGTLRRDHDHVDFRLREDLLEVHVEAMREGQRRALLDVRLDRLLVDLRLVLVRQQHHHEVGTLDRVIDFLDGETGCLRLLPGRAALAKADGDLHAGILQVVGVGMALRAVAEDGDAASLDQGQVGVLVVKDVHAQSPRCVVL